jgi:UPF0755 protein
MNIRKIFITIFFSGCILFGWFTWKIFGPQVNAPADGYFYISTGSSYETVLHELKEKNLLSSTFYFELINRFRHYDVRIRPGKYKITQGMSTWRLFSMLRNGSQEAVRFVINKCRTKEELASRIGKYFETDSLNAIKMLNNPDTLQQWGIDTTTALSLIIPNTYLFHWNASFSQIFKKLNRQHDLFWEGERTNKAKQLGLEPLQAYILASIVEEETNKEEDKSKIASVYINRLNKGMKLQADPTVKYAMKNFGMNRIYLKHLSYESPYNTYLHNGLPPGPICTPSINTIDEVLNAPKTHWLYFVAKPDFSGYSVFEESYAAHQINAKRYQEALNEYMNRKNQKDSSRP